MMTIYLPGTSPNSSRTGSSTRKWKIFWSYLPDWILAIFLWAIFYLLDKVNGYRRLFSITDESLAHPYAENVRIPVWLLAILCGIVPGVLIILTGAVIRRSFWDVHCGVLGLILGLGLSQTLTTFLKITAGRPRPDLFSRCQPPESLTSNPVHGLTSWTVCTRTDLLKDGFRSWPSGHSSFAWTGMWYLILYGAAKMRLLNRQGYVIRAWLLLAPLSCASLVAVSRTMDYRHHSTDVLTGGIIGVLAAWLSYRQFHPAVSDIKSYKPYPPRIPHELSLPVHHNSTPDDSNRNIELVRTSLIPKAPEREHSARSRPADRSNRGQNGRSGNEAVAGL